MKTSKKWAITFTIINIVLIGVCCFFLLRKDRNAPEIAFQENNLIYYSGIEQDRLFDGVTAYDLKDGDVTARIVIEKVVQEDGRAVVYYAVTDYDGNVGKASRIFDAADESMGDAVLDIGTAGINGELEATVQDTQEEPDTAVETSPSPTMSPTPSPTPSPTSTPTPKPTPNREEEQRRQQQEEEERQQAEEIRRAQEAAKAGNPKIILKSTTINTIAGQTPAWVEVISSFQDDHDGYEMLFRNLKSSKYDVNEKGDHAVSLTTTDSDGNVSDPVTVTVHVK